MWSIFVKEIAGFFSSLIGYVVVGLFLLSMSLILFVWEDYSILDSSYASLDQLFDIAPIVFAFLVPAVTMSLTANEKQTGTIELLLTRPIRETDIVMGKFFAALTLVMLSLIPTLLYYYTVYQLGIPHGNLDSGAVAGSYLGLLLLAASYAAIGLFASSLVEEQIVSFLIALFLSLMLFWGFDLFSRLSIFSGQGDLLIQQLGMKAHYLSISRGVIDSRDIVYFGSVTMLFSSFY